MTWSADNFNKTHYLGDLQTWACDMVTWYWSADTYLTGVNWSQRDVIYLKSTRKTKAACLCHPIIWRMAAILRESLHIYPLSFFRFWTYRNVCTKRGLVGKHFQSPGPENYLLCVYPKSTSKISLLISLHDLCTWGGKPWRLVVSRKVPNDLKWKTQWFLYSSYFKAPES